MWGACEVAERATITPLGAFSGTRIAERAIPTHQGDAFQVGDASPRGTYLIIAEALRAELANAAGPWAMLSEADLQRRFKVSRTTVRRALRILAGEGLLEAQKGIGWRPTPADGPTALLHEQITKDIVAAVQRGDLRVGESIQSETELAKTFNVSRGKVRQALARLEGAGLVVAVPGKARRLCANPVLKRDGDSAAPPPDS